MNLYACAGLSRKNDDTANLTVANCVTNSRIIVGNINTDGGVFIGGSVIVNGDFIGGTKRKIVIK